MADDEGTGGNEDPTAAELAALRKEKAEREAADRKAKDDELAALKKYRDDNEAAKNKAPKPVKTKAEKEAESEPPKTDDKTADDDKPVKSPVSRWFAPSTKAKR
jgi:hypothetical protein